MALAAGNVWEINSAATASNVNGGGFNTANANFITDYAATVANTAAPVVTSATYTFVAGDVGAWLYVKSGTNWTPGFYQIASVAGGAATLNASVGAAVQLNSATGYYAPSTVVGCATVASPTSGTCGLDFSRGTAAIINGTDLASADGDNNPTTVTSAGTPFSNRFIGNLIHITAGASWTAGWYEIVSCSGANAVLDRAASGTNGSITGGTFYVGGALSLGTATDDAVFESLLAGNHCFVKGALTFGGTVNVSSAAFGNRSSAVTVQGYKTVRGETLAVADYPTVDIGATVFTLGEFWKVRYLNITGTGNPYCVSVSAFTKLSYCKVVNTGAALAAIYTAGGSFIYGCDLKGGSGAASAISAGSYTTIMGNYIHDTATGILMNTGFGIAVINNIIAACSTVGLDFTSSSDSGSTVVGNTFYGAETPAGIGLRVIANTYRVAIVNNIFYGWTTALSAAGTTQVHYNDYNNFYNNTTNATNVQKGPNDQAISPSFTDAAGGNWAVGIGLKGLGAPAGFLSTSTTSYPDIGAVQREETSSVSSARGIGSAKFGG
jgi:hypothetical protein